MPFELASAIEAAKETLLCRWEAQCLETLATARRVDAITLRDSMPKLVDELVRHLRRARDSAPKAEIAREHGEDRASSPAYSLTEMIVEYRLFRRVLVGFAREAVRPSADAIDELNDFVDTVIQKATDEYVETERALQTRISQTAASLRETQSQLSLALASAGAGTWYLDIPKNRIFGSAQTAKIYGVAGIEGDLSDAVDKFVFTADQTRVNGAMARAIETGGTFAEDFRITRADDGRTRWSHARGSVLYDEAGKPLRLIGIQTDITEQKELEIRLREAKTEAERANSAKSAFLANMSHEMRSPLGTILGFSELLKTASLARAEVETFVTVIDRNAKHLLNVVDDILDLSKVEAGKMVIERLAFSLSELLAEIESVMEFRAREKGIEFHLKRASALPDRIVTDPTRLRQILNNVVGNALKFTERGLVQLSVSFADGQLKFVVSDTGTGIAPDRASRLFQPFEQADASTSRRFGGTGLGLALTRRLSEALGGTFALEKSSPGVGSVFVATIEVEVASETAAEPAPPRDERLDGLRVLIVDDSPDNQALFSLLLGKAGAAVEVAKDGFEGVNLARTNDYDVVLMDVQMPRMDGHRATRSLREIGYTVPIIALTAHAMAEERERATNVGFTDYLSKPVSREELLGKLARYKGDRG